MLDLILPHLDDHVAVAPDAVEACLTHEAAAIVDIPFLEEHVTGVADYEWDYTALDTGFMALVAPYLALRPRTGDLYSRALHELADAAAAERLLKGLLLIDYPLIGTYVNDYYNFHPHFGLKDLDPRVCSRLTQLRYAGQYLCKYPAYLLVRNELDLSPTALGAAQKLGASAYVIAGIGRGQFMHWCHRGFAGVTLEQYYQTTVNNLHGFVILPAQQAAAFTDMAAGATAILVRALSHLAVGLKLLAELRYLRGDLAMPTAPEARGTATVALFPGYALLSRGLPLDCTPPPDRDFPDIHALHAAATALAREVLDDALIAEMQQAVATQVAEFRSAMAKLPALGATAAAITHCLDQEGVVR